MDQMQLSKLANLDEILLTTRIVPSGARIEIMSLLTELSEEDMKKPSEQLKRSIDTEDLKQAKEGRDKGFTLEELITKRKSQVETLNDLTQKDINFADAIEVAEAVVSSNREDVFKVILSPEFKTLRSRYAECENDAESEYHDISFAKDVLMTYIMDYKLP